MNILAFDLGGSGGKMFLGRLDCGQFTLETVHRFDNEPAPIGDGLYWDFVDIWRQLNIGIQKAIQLTGDEISSLGIDSFSNDFILVHQNSEILSPLRCYRDSRTRKWSSEIYSVFSPEQLYTFTGNQNAPFNTFMQLAAMRLAGQGFLLDHAHKLLFTPDALVHFMTGKFVSEYTISSVSQLFDFASQNWCDPILEAFQIPKKIFGDLVMPGTVVGPTSRVYNQQAGTKGFQVVSVCEHDTASAFLSSVCDEDCAIISCGTWALVGLEVQEPVIQPFGLKYNLANEGGYPQRHRILRNVMGSWVIQQIRAGYKDMGQDFTYAEMEQAAAKEAAFAYLVDIDDEAFYEPGNMPRKLREYCQKQYGHAPQRMGQLVRCVYESLAMKFRWAIEKLEVLTEKDLKLVNILGGGSKDTLLCQFTADACGKPVLAGPAEATALGNILVQMVANGAVADLQQGKQLLRAAYPAKEYTPEHSDIWDKEYQAYKKQYELD